MERRQIIRGLLALAILATLPACAPQPAPQPGHSDALRGGLFRQAEHLRDIAPAGDGFTLARGVLIEDDGPAFGLFDPAAGSADSPYWEAISATVQARKTLVVGPLSARGASLLIFAQWRSGVLNVKVNGANRQIDLTQHAAPRPEMHQPRWWTIPIDAQLLHTGENEVVLAGNGPTPGWRVLIAPKDHVARGSAGGRKTVSTPGRSFRSDDRGQTWQSNKLGQAGAAAGEYAVRLLLDQHAITGRWTGPMIDLADERPHQAIRDVIRFRSATVQANQAVPSPSRVEWEYRVGSQQLARKESWGPWTKATSQPAGQFRIGGLNNRYVQLRATLSTEDPAVAPTVHAVRVLGEEPIAQTRPDGLLRVVAYCNPRIVRGSQDFTWETLANPRLAVLDSRFGLGETFRGIRGQFDYATAALRWTATARKRGLFVPAGNWYAGDILATQLAGAGSPLPYELIYCQALIQHGVPARIVLFDSSGRPPTRTTRPDADRPVRPACEFWSNAFGKWVLADATGGQMFIDAATEQPMSALDLHERLVAENSRRSRLPQRPRTWGEVGVRRFSPAGLLPDGPADAWPAGAVMLVPRSNFASSDRPTPLNVEWSGVGWTEAVAFGEPAERPWLPNHVIRRRDVYPTLNQAQMEIQHGQSPGELWVYLDTQTPWFDAFDVNIDEAGWRVLPGASQFLWKLVPGGNYLQVRTRNKAGALGPASSITVHFLPPRANTTAHIGVSLWHGHPAHAASRANSHGLEHGQDARATKVYCSAD